MKNIVSQIIKLPKDFLEQRTKSPYDLLLASNYADFASKISVADIYSELKATDDKMTEYWLDYSAGQRTSSGWYFTKKDRGYEVGFYNFNRFEQVQTFTDKQEACAHYIKNEIDGMISRPVSQHQ